MTDVANGPGAYLAVFLKGAQNWGAREIEVALAVSTIAGAVSESNINLTGIARCRSE
ncbi:MAG: hypothetical protein ACREFP_19270 [Acetobacteraceae bacterium]